MSKWATSLSDSDIEEIRKLLSDGISQNTIAKKYGITQSTVSKIKNNKDPEQRGNRLAVYLQDKILRDDIKNIAKNKGISIGVLLSPELRKFRDTFSQSMRKPHPKN